MSVINAVPNVAVGARFWTYYFKPADNPTYFVASTALDVSPPMSDLWTPGDDLYFAPTQILISYTSNAGGRKLVLEITGRDQFGYLADEVVTLTGPSGAGGTSKQGTARCYTRIESMTVGATSTDGAGDTYSLGIGLSFGDEASPAPRGDDTFRIPLLARVREPEQVLAVQDVFDARFHLPGGTLDLVRDLENLALEITMVTASPAYPNATAAKRFGVVFDSDSTSI